jgi:hypothetical protein
MKKTRYLLPALYIAVLAVLYLCFFNRYLPEYIDDAWTLSWAYNWFENGEAYDTVFGYLDGDGGSSLFSRTTVLVYGAVYSLFDAWGYRGIGFILSTLFLFGGVLCWTGILKGMKYDRVVVWWFAAVMLLLELYFGMAHKIRVDALSFFLASLALLFFVRGWYFPAALAGMIGAENHPFAMVFIPWCLAVLFAERTAIRENPRKYITGGLLFLAGLAAGIGYWLLLHKPWLSGFADLTDRAGGNPFITYFFLKRYSWRHWPELAVFVLALVLFLVKKLWREDKFIMPLLAACVATSFMIPRGNNHYVVFLYPPVILMILTVFKKIRHLNLLLAGLLVFQVPQYGLLFWPQRHYNQQDYLSRLKSEVAAAEKGGDPLPVFGHSNAWFAFYDREFYAYGYWSRAHLETADDWPRKFLLIENKDFRKEYKKVFEEKTSARFERTELSRFKYYDGSPVIICRYVRRPGNLP